ncbi:hypothetical protein, conserved [Eimeria praecox]|uniref:Uncharacterized protein n=1 Tax=Eimeria praecox TaxID=51316 RepID=U6G6E8_9EIME|nr:hypothetical protein, conserved [Eimeria praecox]
MDQAGERLALSLLEAKARTLGSYAMTANEGTSVHTNNVLDTPAGLQAEARTDIRALGKLLYELCCLEPPQYMSCISGSELSCQVANEANDGSRWSQLRQGGVPQAAGSWGLENVTRKQQLYPPISQRYRPEVAQLVHLLLLGEARTLPTAAGILGMPFLETSRKAVAMQLSKFPQNEESSAVVAHDYGRTSMPLRSKSASLHIDLYIVPRVRIRCSFRRSAATDPNTGSYDWLFYVFPRDTDPSQPTVQQATREPVGEKASPCLRVADSTAPLTSKQEEIIFNSRPSLVASTWTENCRCGEQLVEGGRNIGAGEKDPKYLAYLADVVDGPTAAKMGQQLQPQKNEPLFGEAAVNAVLTAQKLRRKQQIAERECQLSKIRSEYAKDKKAVEETVRNRLLQEGNRGTPMQISAKQRKMKTGASILPNDGTLGTNATENAHQTYLGSTANPVAVPFTPSSQYSDLRRLAKGWENMKDSIPVEVSVPPCAVPSACKTAKEEGSMEATLDSPTNAAASLRVKDSRMAGMAQDSRNIHRPQKEEQDPNVQEVTIDHSVASCTVTDEVWRQQQQHVLPVAFWESIDPNEGFTTMELSVSETISVPLPDSVGHHQLRRFVQQPTLHVRVGLREDETCCSCTEECQLLPVAHFALSSTGCSN